MAAKTLIRRWRMRYRRLPSWVHLILAGLGLLALFAAIALYASVVAPWLMEVTGMHP